MTTASSVPKTVPLLSKPVLCGAGLAAVAGCAAACSAPLFLVALGVSGTVTALSGFAGGGVELIAGGLAFVGVLSWWALRARRNSTVAGNPAPAPAGPIGALPVVCDPTLFTKEERAQHIEHTKRLLVELPAHVRPVEDGIEFHYVAKDDVFIALADWAQFEHRCCAWARFTLELAPFTAGTAGGITLRMTGSPEIAPLLWASLQQLEGGGPIIQQFLRGESALTGPPAATRRACGC